MSYKALYRQLRPDNFDDVIGQDHLVNTLKAQIMNNRISHAYLFCGPRGIGKTTVARIMAKAINCQSPIDGNMCGKCSTCAALNDPANLDIVEIDAASNNKVEDVRDLRENIKFMPAAGRYRVYIIDEVHMLSNSAFNALLKTLEEPPAHIVFILATTEPNKLPITVLSRCQRFDFKRVTTEEITKLLKKISKEKGIDIEDNALLTIARFSEGGVRDAISLLDQSSMFIDETITVAHVYELLGSANKLMYFALSESIINKDIKRALLGFNKMLQSGCNINTVANDIMLHFRDLYMAKYVNNVGDALNTDDASAARYVKQSNTASDSMLLNCIEIFAGIEVKIRHVNNPKIWLEMAISKACRVKNDDSYEELLIRIDELENKLSNVNAVEIKNAKKNESSIENTEVEAEYFPYEDNKSVVNEGSADDIGLPEPPMDDVDFGLIDNIADVEQNNEDNTEKPVQEKEIINNQFGAEVDFDNNSKKTSLLDRAQGIVHEEEAKEQKAGSKSPNSDKQNCKKIWKQVMDKVTESKKRALLTAMKKCKPVSCNDKVLSVQADPKSTYYDRVCNAQSRDLINTYIKEVTGKNIKVVIEDLIISEEESNFIEEIGNIFDKDLVNTKL